MKKWVSALIFLGIMTVSQGALVFEENFNGQSLSKTNSGPVLIGGTGSQHVNVEQWFGPLNGVAINNELQLNNFNNNKSRGAAVWLDSSGWDIGTVTVRFDILDYTAGGVDSESFYQAYYANGVDGSNYVGIDLHGAGGADPITNFTGSATIGTIGARNTITANATQAEFTFNFTGQEKIALVFHNMSAATDTAMPIYSIDNLSVNTIPEPAAFGMLMGVGAGLLQLFRRKLA